MWSQENDTLILLLTIWHFTIYSASQSMVLHILKRCIKTLLTYMWVTSSSAASFSFSNFGMLKKLKLFLFHSQESAKHLPPACTSSVIPQLGTGQGNVYAILTPSLKGRDVVFRRESHHEPHICPKEFMHIL